MLEVEVEVRIQMEIVELLSFTHDKAPRLKNNK